MNARINPTISQPTEVTGDLLYTGYQLTDTLQIDLYGDETGGEDGEIEVYGVALTGDVNRTDITELFSASKLADFGTWIQFKDDTSKEFCVRQASYRIARLPI
jgi:hypothetical protein